MTKEESTPESLPENTVDAHKVICGDQHYPNVKLEKDIMRKVNYRTGI